MTTYCLAGRQRRPTRSSPEPGHDHSAAELQDALRLAMWLPGWANGCVRRSSKRFCRVGGRRRKRLGNEYFRIDASSHDYVLRDRNAAPAATAVTALILIWMRNAYRVLRQLLPAENFELLNSPIVAPGFLVDSLVAEYNPTLGVGRAIPALAAGDRDAAVP